MLKRADVPDAILSLAAAAGLALAPALAPVPLAGQDTTAAGQRAAPAGQAAAPTVDGAILSTGVRDHVPVDTLSAVPADVGRLFLWTRITGAEDSTSVLHVWHRGEEEVARVELPVRSPDWRTYSTKRILPSWTGPWRVEIRDAAGRVLQTVNFAVRAAGGGEMAPDTGGGPPPDSAGGR